MALNWLRSTVTVTISDLNILPYCTLQSETRKFKCGGDVSGTSGGMCDLWVSVKSLRSGSLSLVGKYEVPQSTRHMSSFI